jgi:hypothetical protein
MKSINNILKIILGTGFLFSYTPLLNAQDCKCPEVRTVLQTEPTSVLTEIRVSEYPYFLNIAGLKKYSNIQYIGLDENSYPEADFFTIKSKNKGMNLKATYGKDGNLIDGRLIMENVPLPKTISGNLVTDEYKGWTMTGNKIIVHDFNAHKTQYEVKLQHDKMKQTLFFDYAGNRIKNISRT